MTLLSLFNHLSLVGPFWSQMSCCSFHSLFLLHILSLGNLKYFCKYIIHIWIILKCTLVQFSFLSSRLRTSRFLLNVFCSVECPKTLKFNVPSHSSFFSCLTPPPFFLQMESWYPEAVKSENLVFLLLIASLLTTLLLILFFYTNNSQLWF